MILELILIALIAILVYAIYKIIVIVYSNTHQGYGMIYKGKHYTFPELDVLADSVREGKLNDEYYKGHYTRAYGEYPMSYFSTIDDSVIRKVYNILSNYMVDMNDIDRANFMLAFVQQNVKYVSDNVEGYSDLWKFPVTTLVDRKGDCEDSAFLLTALYYFDGLNVITAWVTRHMTVGVCLPVPSNMTFICFGSTYACAEPTGKGKVGSGPTYPMVYYTVKPLMPTEEFKSCIIKEKD